MNKLFGLFLLALAFFAPVSANAAARFWVGGTGTWDGSSTTNWAATSGGAGGQSVPGSSDTATFDSNSGGGTVTVNTAVTIQQLNVTTYTGTLDFATNNNNVDLSASPQGLNMTNSGVRTVNMGSGTWTFSGTGVNLIDASGTNLTLSSSNANLVFSGNSANRSASFGTSRTYGSLTINNNSTKGWFALSATTAVTFGSVTVGSGNSVGFSQGITTTITGALIMTGTSSDPVMLTSNAPGTNIATVSVGSASTVDWGAVLRVTKAGAGSITATNALDLGGNTGITITPPSAGGGGRCIGC